MAGKPKRSIDFAGWNADIFENDTKIDELIDGQGWIGFSIYFYLCQKAYASDGYFYRWSYANAATTARRMGGGIRSETIKQVVALCLRVGLFDKRLFDREGVLTSRGIQRRYMVAIEKRSFKKVEEKFWLLNEDESKDVIVVPENTDSLPENTDSLPERETKESKLNKSTLNENRGKEKADTSAPSPSQISEIIDLYHEICISYPKVTVISDLRKRALKALVGKFSVEQVKTAFENAEKSDFLRGNNGRNWKANFDWLIKESNFVKVLDGNYNDQQKKSNSDDDLEQYKEFINVF